MTKKTNQRAAVRNTVAGRRLIQSVQQAIAWASGENVPVRVTMGQVRRVPRVNLLSLRRKLGLSQSQFATR